MKKVIKYIVRDKNRLMLDEQTRKQFSTQARQPIHNDIFNNVSPLTLVDNIIFWDLLAEIYRKM